MAAPRSRAPHRDRSAGDIHAVRLPRVLDIVLMGRFPHLGTFALEGPGGSVDRAAGARGHRHVGLRGSAVRDAQRRRETARRDRERAGAESRNSCSSTSRRLRSISAIRSDVQLLLRTAEPRPRRDDGAVDARLESGGRIVPRSRSAARADGCMAQAATDDDVLTPDVRAGALRRRRRRRAASACRPLDGHASSRACPDARRSARGWSLTLAGFGTDCSPRRS